MRFGAHYLPTYIPHLDGSVGNFYRSMFEQIEEMERIGYDQIWVTEHHFSEYGGMVPHPPTFLSAIARTTKTIRLGIAISVLPLHNPLEVAESYAMADVVSNGRLEFGVGKGSEAIEYKRFGAHKDEASQRMMEGTEVILRAWSDDPVRFHGEFYQYDNVRVLPKPAQRPHPPIWVGCARTDDSFRWAGENGFNLMTLPYLYPKLGSLESLLKTYHDSLARAGHDLTERQILGKFHIYVSDSLVQAVEEATPYLKNYGMVHAAADPNRTLENLFGDDVQAQMEEGLIIGGEPERCIDAIRCWQEKFGLTTLTGTFHFGGMPQELALKNIRRFAEQVMPAFK